MSFGGIKIRCENRYWSRAVQLVLHRTVGCDWGRGCPAVPWNVGRLLLVVQPSARGGYFFSWATPGEFDRCELPEWSARDLVAAAPSGHGVREGHPAHGHGPGRRGAR